VEAEAGQGAEGGDRGEGGDGGGQGGVVGDEGDERGGHAAEADGQAEGDAAGGADPAGQVVLAQGDVQRERDVEGRALATMPANMAGPGSSQMPARAGTARK
jgi:hypothetical protein